MNEELQQIKRIIPEEDVLGVTQDAVHLRFRRTEYRQFVAKLLLPNDYPSSRLYVEITSNTLDRSTISRLQNKAEEHALQAWRQEQDKNNNNNNKEHGQQMVACAMFLKTVLDESRLLACGDEVASLRRHLDPSPVNRLRINDRKGTLSLHLEYHSYYINAKVNVPENYPYDPPSIRITGSNLMKRLVDIIRAHTEVLAIRRSQGKESNTLPVPASVAASSSSNIDGSSKTRKKHENRSRNASFSSSSDYPLPSIERIVWHIKTSSEDLVTARCVVSKRPLLPSDPDQQKEYPEYHKKRIERLTCGHYVFYGAAVEFVSQPPFDKPKKCPACGQRISHHRLNTNSAYLERRWAHKQASKREVNEVAEFMDS